MSRLVALVVDDEPDILALLTDLLKSEGFSVVGMSDPCRLLDHVSPLEPSIILLDMMMPGMSGLELAKRLRRGRYPTTPMIALSAAPAMLARADDSGCFAAILEKPFDLADLLALIERHTT